MFNEKSDKWADVYTLKDFHDCIKCGAFIASDGDGYFGNETHFSYDYSVWSMLEDMQRKPEGATHIHWFNK